MTKINEQTLLISEIFYSVQCEGISSGVPSVFIRLAMCNLTCGFSNKFVNAYAKQTHEVIDTNLIGDLHASGDASWTCDTMPVWIKGQEWEFREVIDWFKRENIYEDILNGTVHIVWTGGEPAIPGHQKSIYNFLKYLAETKEGSINNVYSEIETNGTLNFSLLIGEGIINQVNCSPKLSNSGMSEKKRIRPEVINWLNTIDEDPREFGNIKVQFKFVISTEDDIFEMFETYIKPFNIPLTKVVCMPGLDSQEDFHERTRWVLEMAKKYKFIGLTRLHVSAWDKTTGC
jgi:organic radical activating enzyme